MLEIPPTRTKMVDAFLLAAADPKDNPPPQPPPPPSILARGGRYADESRAISEAGYNHSYPGHGECFCAIH